MKKTILTLVSLLVITCSFGQKTKIVIETTFGKIVAELYDNTPLHTNNMIKLANEHFYDSLLFHRVIPGFVIQGGDPNSKHAKEGEMLGNGEHGDRIPAEINDSDFHKRGALAMARDNNPQKASSGCQFYIVTGKVVTDQDLDNIENRTGRKFAESQRQAYKKIGGVPFLDGNYTVFGEVLEGMDVVDKISNVERDQYDRPKQDVRILSIRVLGNEGGDKIIMKFQATKEKKKKKRHKFLGIF
jgi:peptidyl-prolyl cis-trans isomerase B (cyclophilin B)